MRAAIAFVACLVNGLLILAFPLIRIGAGIAEPLTDTLRVLSAWSPLAAVAGVLGGYACVHALAASGRASALERLPRRVAAAAYAVGAGWLLVHWARSGEQDFLVVASAVGVIGALTFLVARRLASPPRE